MKVNPHTDELLCGYIDGELSLRQQTEVQRLAARDPEVTERLRQLQQSRNLISAMPRIEAPGEMLEQIRAALERKTLLDDRANSAQARAGSRHLRIRKFVAAAAMIALVGVLGGVVYQIVAPVTPVEAPRFVAHSGSAALPSVESTPAPTGPGFSGRLELRTASLAQAESFIKAAVEHNGLAGYTEVQSAAGRRVYHVACSSEGLDRLVADLGKIGRHFESATLTVDTDHLGDPVVIDPVTLEQAAQIVAQDDAQERVETANHVALMNAFAREMPGRDILSIAEATRDVVIPSLDIPMPRITSNEASTKVIEAPPQGKVNASLTIVLLNTR